MSKKALLSMIPLLVTVALAAVPAMASAETKEYGTETESVFTPFRKVKNISSTGEARFEFAGEEIKCGTLIIHEGTDENLGGIGKGKETFTLEKCIFSTGSLAGCEVASTAASKSMDINATDEAIKETKVEIKLTPPGMSIVTTGVPSGCPKGTSLGKVEGSWSGTQAKKSNILAFTPESSTLSLDGERVIIMGSDETFTEVGKGEPRLPVVIN